MKVSEAAKREHAAYMREYRRLHPDKIREINRRYWERKAAAKEARENESNKTCSDRN